MIRLLIWQITCENYSHEKGKHNLKTHSFNWGCYNCVCSVCTRRHCTYSVGGGCYQYRCKLCVKANGNGDFGKLYECDFFENKHTSRRRFKIKRKFHKEDAIIGRLDKIMTKLEIPTDGVEPLSQKHNYLSDETKRILKKYNYR